MKFMIIGLISAFSISSMACPTFNGTYECRGEGIEQTLNLKTSQVNGVTTYTVDNTSVAADGVYRKVDFMGGMYDVAASCKDQTAILKIKLDGGNAGESEACGNQAWHLLYTTQWTANGKNITEKHSGATVCADGKVVPEDMDGTMVCTLK